MIKNAARDLYWRLYGLGYRNPPLPHTVSRIVFICSGNICRSPFAERLFRGLLSEPAVLSFGLDAEPGASPPADVIEAASRFGVALEAQRARRFDAGRIGAEDLLVFVDLVHLRRLCREHPELRDRSLLLPLVDPEPPAAGEGSRYRIPDPYGTDLERATSRLGRVKRCVEILAKSLRQSRANL
jgi:protein-tyrosine phosphatase